LTYQWKKDGSAISGETASTLDISSAMMSSAGTYTVDVIGTCGTVTSANAVVTINVVTAISAQPVDATICENGTVAVSVSATGTGLTYQWLKDGSVVSGAMASTLNITSATTSNSGVYTVNVTGMCGILTSTGATVTVNPKPTVSIATPASLGCVNSSVTLDASGSTGIGVLAYAWAASAGGSITSGGATDMPTAGSAGTYMVTVTDANGCTATGSTSVTGSAAAIALSPAGTATATSSCDDMGWTYYGDGTTTFFAINWAPDGSLSAANAAAKAAASVSIGKDAATANGQFVEAGTMKHVKVMSRYWNVANAGTFDEAVNVRFFYAPAEKTAAEFAGGSFKWFKTVGTAYSPSVVNNTNGISVDYVELATPTISTMNGVTYAEFAGLTGFSGGTGAGTDGAAFLPIELTKFNAKAENKVNQITWTTKSERNTDKFIIERSLNGQSGWVALATVKAKGGSVETNYNTTDNNPAPMTYYRLRALDFDGKEQISTVVSVMRRANKFEILTVYPNPTTEFTNVVFEVTNNQNVEMTLTDLSGRIIFTRSTEVKEGVNNLQLDLGDVAQGTYMLLMRNGESRVTKLVTKQ
jgi:hypothetical protein